GLLVFFLLVFLFLMLRRQRRRAAAVEVRLLAVERAPGRGTGGNQRAVSRQEEPADPRLRAHDGVEDPAQRDRAAALFFLDKRLVIVLDRRQFLVLARPRAPAGGEHEGSTHRGKQDG